MITYLTAFIMHLLVANPISNEIQLDCNCDGTIDYIMSKESYNHSGIVYISLTDTYHGDFNHYEYDQQVSEYLAKAHPSMDRICATYQYRGNKYTVERKLKP